MIFQPHMVLLGVAYTQLQGNTLFSLMMKIIYLFIYVQTLIRSQINLPPIGRGRTAIPHFPFRVLTGVSTSNFHSNDTEYSFGWIGCYPVSKAYQEEKIKNQRTGNWEGPLRAVSLGVANFRIAVTSFPTCFRHY